MVLNGTNFMYKIIGKSLSFNDVLLVPKYSEIASRKDVDLSVSIRDFKFAFPIVPSNMKTITELAMAKLIFSLGGLSIMHRFIDWETQQKWIEEIGSWKAFEHVGFSIGVKPEDYEHVSWMIDHGVRIICIDVANGYSKLCLDMIKFVRNKSKDVLLIAGNVATGEGAKAIWENGADMVKNGIGEGSICTTRIQTGNGVASMTSLMSCFDAKIEMEQILNKDLYLMQDGGCANSGNLCKALCFANFVMCGNIFSATSECPGDIIEKNGKKYKSYVGSSTHKINHKEGVESLKLFKGPATKIINEICDGVKSGLSYQGVSNLIALRKNPEFMTVSHAGIIESSAHDLDEILS